MKQNNLLFQEPMNALLVGHWYIKKSNYVIFRPYQKKLNYDPQVNIFDNESNKKVTLERKNFIKYLGLLIDENLSWKTHIHSVANKISKTIGLIARLRHIVPTCTLLNIYQSLITPYLTYGLISWGNACKTFLDQILTYSYFLLFASSSR